MKHLVLLCLSVLVGCGQSLPSHVAFTLKSQTTSSSALNSPSGFSLSTDYCYAVMVSGAGTGLDRGAINPNTDPNSCPNRPKQLGMIKGLYNSGDSVDLDLPLGTERFDLLAFKKVPTSGNHTPFADCSGIFTTESVGNGSDVNAYLNGVLIDPQVVLMATATQTMSAGTNNVTLATLGDSSGVSMDCSASQLAFGLAPTLVQPDGSLAPQPKVQIFDDAGHLVTAGSSLITLSMAQNADCSQPVTGPGLSPTPRAYSTDGTAQFSGLSTTYAANFYLRATSSNGLSSCSSLVQPVSNVQLVYPPEVSGTLGAFMSIAPTMRSAGLTCSTVVPLPTGLTLDSVSCVISGTPTTAVAGFAATIRGSLLGTVVTTANLLIIVAASPWTSMAAAPLALYARYDHCAVWTDSSFGTLAQNKMVIYGGTDGSTVFSDGAVYDPNANSWTYIPPGSLPVTGGSCGVFNGAMYVWGGISQLPSTQAAGGVEITFNGSTWTTAALPTDSNAPSSLPGQSATVTTAGLQVFGGYLFPTAQAIISTLPFLISPWAPPATLGGGHGRSGHTAVWSGSPGLLIWGGFLDSANLATTGEKIVGSTASDMTETPVSPPVSLHTAFWDTQISRMIVWGGKTASAATNLGGLYDPFGSGWVATNVTNAPSPRFSHTAVWTGTQMIVWGGTPDGTAAAIGTFGLAPDLSGGSWTALSDSLSIGISPRWRHTAVWTGNQMIVWGGLASPSLPKADGAIFTP